MARKQWMALKRKINELCQKQRKESEDIWTENSITGRIIQSILTRSQVLPFEITAHVEIHSIPRLCVNPFGPTLCDL